MIANSRKILIPGGLGFIGSNLAKRCLELGMDVTIYDNLDPNSGGNMFNIEPFRKDVELVIVGLPVNMDGSIGAQAEKVNAFACALRNHTSVPLEFRDERLSTVSAKRLMREGRTRKSKGKTRDDAIAAAIILQGYLDERC